MSRARVYDLGPLKAVKIYQEDYEYLYKEFLKNSLEGINEDGKVKRWGIFADQIHVLVMADKKKEEK